MNGIKGPDRWHISSDAYGPFSSVAFASRDDAIAEGILEYCGDPFYVGLEMDWWPVVDEDDVLDDVRYQAYDQAGEFSENWLENIPMRLLSELRRDLQAVFDRWLVRNRLEPDFFAVSDVRRVDPAAYGVRGNGVAIDRTGEIVGWLTGSAGDERDSMPSRRGGKQGTGDSQEVGAGA